MNRKILYLPEGYIRYILPRGCLSSAGHRLSSHIQRRVCVLAQNSTGMYDGRFDTNYLQEHEPPSFWWGFSSRSKCIHSQPGPKTSYVPLNAAYKTIPGIIHGPYNFMPVFDWALFDS